MRRFKWIRWNLQKIAAHGLSRAEVEAAFDRIESVEARADGSFRMLTETPKGRGICVIWRPDREDVDLPDIFDDLDEVPVFVITAY